MMRSRTTKREPTPEENRARNIARIMNPPKRTVVDRVRAAVYAVDTWWWRRRNPKLAGCLDRLLLLPMEQDPSES